MRLDLLERLGEVTPTRSVLPLWAVAERVNQKNLGLVENNLLSLSYGRVIRKEITEIGGLRPESYETYNIIEAGDAVLRMTDLQNDQRSIRTGLATEKGIITSAYVTVRPRVSTVDPRFLVAALRAYDVKKVFYEMGAGVRQTLKFEELAHLPIPLPPLDDQQRIADFLDRETAEIDAMDAELDHLIDTLRERKKTESMQTVVGATKEDLGVTTDWLPTGWVRGSLGHVVESLDRARIPLSALDRQSRSGPYPYYGASGVIDWVDDFLFDEDLVLVSEDGANLLNRSTPIAFIAAGRYWVNNHAHVLRPRVGPPAFWAARIECIDLAPWVSGSAQPKLTAEAMNSIPVSWPKDHLEMDRIASELEDQTSRIDAMIADAQRLKALLGERRSTLITEVVTGKKEVPS
ncbi:restriction endonuclease subunit S [Tessaracoccus sp. SD287]|uniref:restriction endonuclease subunit S n=1 Tax=Tessaracoccus sp. SD287 TaxID=2782008 RepID=UPI001A971DE8|nr:restriction endonuclease subunit S [Tessaracoccus sp. SD287]MBO1031321.1 restriction endonuclease subunit S [Tessaracoccus sp. SD287]